MIDQIPGLMDEVRDRFAHVDTCPFTGPRVFFENAGGALTLKSVVETSAIHAAYPDNQGRDNPASRALMAAIARGKADARLLFNAPFGQIFAGESGTEVLFRLIRTAALGAPEGGTMLTSTLEHPASRSAMTRWAEVTGRGLLTAAHDDATGTIDAAAYAALVRPDCRVASIVHTSPVTGMAVDVVAVVRAIRAVAPDCFIIVDGIQHASHGSVDIASYGVDGYAVSPYKVFSRHGYGIGWASDRLTGCTREGVLGSPETNWELGTRDSGSYATFSDVVAYFDWLGSRFTPSTDRRARIVAAAHAIDAQEKALMHSVMHGTGNLPGLADMPRVQVIGGAGNDHREGVVSLTLAGMEASDLVAHLAAHGVRTHVRKADHYSGNILTPLGIPACTRVSISHYNTTAEVAQFLSAMVAAGAAEAL